MRRTGKQSSQTSCGKTRMTCASPATVALARPASRPSRPVAKSITRCAKCSRVKNCSGLAHSRASTTPMKHLGRSAPPATWLRRQSPPIHPAFPTCPAIPGRWSSRAAQRKARRIHVTCHTLEKSKDNTPENLSAYIDKVQKGTKKRVDGLKEDLKAIADEHKDWDPKAKDKSKEQLSYERAVTLVSFVESDGSWGFHNPEYTDTILKEAEKIVDSLLK